MKLLIIANPQAANRRAPAAIEPALAALTAAGVEVECRWTAAPGHATELVSTADLDGFDGVVAAGGDGTLFETLNGLMGRPEEQRPALGILPVGTGNAFCRDLELGDRPVDEVVRRMTEGASRTVDVGRFVWGGTTSWFLNILGVGFVTDVSVTAHKLKVVGNLSYTLGVVLETLRLQTTPLVLEIDGERLERDGIFLEISNSRYTSNFLIAPEARIDDGRLDVILANRLSRIGLLRAFPKVFSGEHVHLPEVEVWQARRITISTPEPKTLAPDGEIFGHTPVEVECLPAAIRLLA